MTLTSTHDFLNIGRGESFIKNYYYGFTEEIESKLFICLSIKNKQASAEIMSDSLFEAAREVFFNSRIDDDYKRFETTLKEMNNVIERFKTESMTGKIGELDIIVGVIVDADLYISQTGDAEGYLLRRKHLSVISEGLSEPNQPNTFVNIASGVIDTDDTIVLSSARMLRYITKNDLVKLFSPEGNLEKQLIRLKESLEIETMDQMGVSVVKMHEMGKAIARKRPKIQITQVLTSIKNFSGLKKISQKELFAKLKSQLTNTAAIAKAVDAVKNKFNQRGPVNDQNRQKKHILMGLGAIIVVLLISIIWVKFNGNKQQLINEYEQILTQVQSDVDNAYTIGITDKKKATEILTQAEEKTKEILQSGYLRGIASQRLDTIQEIKEKLDGIKTIAEPKIVADLTEQGSTNAISLNQYKTHLAAFEPHNVYEVILSKVEEGKAIDEGEEMIDGTYFADQQSLVVGTKSNKIVEYKDGRFTYMDNKDTQWKPNVDIKSFNSNIYFLDPQGNQVWKYTRQRDSYSSVSNYIQDSVDLSKAIDMTIDGSIYILENDGTVRRFYGGSEEDVTIKKAPLSMPKNPTKIYTEFENPQLYIVEPSQKRVLIFTKEQRTGNLVYAYQIKFPTLKNIQDIFVDKKSSKMYVLDSNKIYETSI